MLVILCILFILFYNAYMMIDDSDDDYDDVLEFLREYRKHSCLYDSFNPNYKNANLRNRAERTLMKKLKIRNVECLHRKIRNIYETYFREIMKLHTVCDYIPAIWFETADEFLRLNTDFSEVLDNMINAKHKSLYSEDVTEELAVKGINIIKQLRQMNPTQRIYAELLLQKLLTKGLLGKLTEHSDII